MTHDLGLGLEALLMTSPNIAEGAITVALGGNDDVGGANKTDFYFPGVITKATLTVDGDTII